MIWIRSLVLLFTLYIRVSNLQGSGSPPRQFLQLLVVGDGTITAIHPTALWQHACIFWFRILSREN